MAIASQSQLSIDRKVNGDSLPWPSDDRAHPEERSQSLICFTLDSVCGKNIIKRNSNATDILDGLTCYVCGLGDEGSPAKHLSDCTDVQKCQPGEFCYLEHIYDLKKGTDYFVGGCRASDSSACDKQEQKRHVSAKGHNIPVFSEGYVIKLAGMN
ncbi:Hypothetical predicted protein [Mytilus galloprovincialis]|uniref:Uncharacterized protein n=1 Tax=Mytilus galloprovincialis TaxID=29158 RepID=A0A8B6DQP6_MYTGA|nr:Hypothetical predicted protein [Mytilus galloprovincialis]